MNGDKFKLINSQNTAEFKQSNLNDHELSVLDIYDDDQSSISTFKSSDDEQKNDQEIFKNLHETEGIELLTNTFKDSMKAFEYIKNLESLQMNINSKKIVIVKFDIDLIEKFSQLELSILKEKFINHSVIVILINKAEGNPLIYWKLNNSNFYELKPIYKKQHFNDLFEYVVNFLIKSLSDGHLGILNFISAHQEINIIDLHFLADSREYNLMLIAAEEGNDKIVEILLELGFNSRSPVKDVNAQSLAYKSKHFHVLLMLLESNMMYPLNINIDECSDEIKYFHQMAVNLHEAIKSKNEEQAVEIITNNSNLRHFYNHKNESAPTIALANKQTDMYKLLISRNVHFSPHENTDDIMDKFEYAERRDLREFHNKHAKDLPEKHLNTLMISSVVGHDESEVHNKPDLVMRAFKLLNSILLIRIILKIVAASKKLQLVFDFNRESVEVVDPTVNSNTFGLFYLTGRIYIGALRLLNKATECETLGTIAHELCHYAIHLTFENHAKPYRKNDKKTEREFEKISKMCMENKKKDLFIGSVYDEYPEKRHHAELIVRVPHILAFYSDELDVIEDRRKTFKPLFDFFEEKIVPEMERVLPDIELKAEQKVKEKDEKISKLIKIIIGLIISSLVIVGLLFVILYKPDINFKGLSSSDREAIKNSFISYKNVNVKFRDLVQNNEKVYEKLSSDQLRSIIGKKVLNGSDPHLKFLHDYIVHDWEGLAENLKDEILKLEFNFQNESIKFANLNKIYSNSFNYLTSSQINNILDHISISVGGKIDNNTEFYVERTFYDNRVSEWKTDEFLNSNQIIENAKENKMLILSSEAGMGKTVTFEQLTLKIKKRYPMRWVSFIDLKKFIKFYNKNGKIEDVKNLLQKILNLESKSEFENELFKEMYDLGDVILLWNGFDEISPTYSEYILNVLSVIQNNTNNIQFICTRPIYSDVLKKKLNISAYALKRFSNNERRDFIKKYFDLKQFDEDITNDYIRKTEELLRKFDFRTFDNTGMSYQFDTPLIIKLFAEIAQDKEIADSPNLYQIYQIFIEKKVEIWVKTELGLKANIKLVSGGLNINQIYQKYALRSELVTLLGSSILLKLNKLQIMQNTIPEDFPFVEISRMGIMFISEETAFEFSHKTFSEFFVAQYFIDNIYNAKHDVSDSEAELRLELFYRVVKLYFESEKSITDFMMFFLKIQNNQSDMSFNTALGNLLKTKLKRYFIKFIDSKWNIFEFLIDFYKKDPEVLSELLLINENETFCTAFFNPYNLGMFVEAYCPDHSTVNFLTDSEYKKLRIGSNQKGIFFYSTMFHSAYAFLKKKIQFKTTPKEIETCKYCNYHRIDYTLNEMILNLEKQEVRELALPILSPKVTDVFELGSINERFAIWKDFESRLDSEDMKVILGILFQDVFSFVFELSKQTKTAIFFNLLLTKSEILLNNTQIYWMFKEKHILHYSVVNFKACKEVWTLLTNSSTENQRKMILLEKYSNLTSYANPSFNVLHRSFIYGTIKTIDFITKAYERHFSLPEIRKIMSSSSDFLIYFIYHADIPRCQLFAKYLKNIFENDEKQLRNYIKRKIPPTGLSIFEYFQIFPDDLTEKLKILKDVYEEANI